jgi:hypothetical protein
LPDGSLLAELDIQPAELRQTGIERRFKRLVILRPNGRVVDTLAREFLRGETIVFVGARGSIGTARAPLSPFGHTEVHGDAIYFGDGEEFVVRKLDLTGKLIQEYRGPDGAGVHLLAPPEAKAIVEEFTSQPRMSAAFASMLRTELEKIYVRGKVAFFDSMLVDRTARVWVRESKGYTSSVRTWLVFDPSGRVIGRVSVPKAWSVLEIGGDYILVTTTGDLGYTIVAEFPLL